MIGEEAKMGDEDIATALVKICNLTGHLGQSPALRTGTSRADELKVLLYNAREKIFELIETSFSEKFHISLGIGNGYVPRVPWIFISQKMGPVSKKWGVAICFGRQGNGLIIGNMAPVGESIIHTQRERRKNDITFIDVDGDSEITKYNNRFLEPVEIFKDHIENEIIEKTIEESIKSLKFHLKNLG